jgi:hypothetical protein
MTELHNSRPEFSTQIACGKLVNVGTISLTTTGSKITARSQDFQTMRFTLLVYEYAAIGINTEKKSETCERYVIYDCQKYPRLL